MPTKIPMIASTTRISIKLKADRSRKFLAVFVENIETCRVLTCSAREKQSRCLEMAGILTPDKSAPPSHCSSQQWLLDRSDSTSVTAAGPFQNFTGFPLTKCDMHSVTQSIKRHCSQARDPCEVARTRFFYQVLALKRSFFWLSANLAGLKTMQEFF